MDFILQVVRKEKARLLCIQSLLCQIQLLLLQHEFLRLNILCVLLGLLSKSLLLVLGNRLSLKSPRVFIVLDHFEHQLVARGDVKRWDCFTHL